MSHFSHYPNSKFPKSITAPTWYPISPIIQTADSQTALLHLRDVPFLPPSLQQIPKQHYCTYVMSHFSHYRNSKFPKSITAPTWCPIPPTILRTNSRKTFVHQCDVPFFSSPKQQIRAINTDQSLLNGSDAPTVAPAPHLPLYCNLIERRTNVDIPKTCSLATWGWRIDRRSRMKVTKNYW